MFLRPPRSTLTDTLCPYTPLVRSLIVGPGHRGEAGARVLGLVGGLGQHPVDACVDEPVAGLLEQEPADDGDHQGGEQHRSEEHTSELPSLMRISYAVF